MKIKDIEYLKYHSYEIESKINPISNYDHFLSYAFEAIVTNYIYENNLLSYEELQFKKISGILFGETIGREKRNKNFSDHSKVLLEFRTLGEYGVTL